MLNYTFISATAQLELATALALGVDQIAKKLTGLPALTLLLTLLHALFTVAFAEAYVHIVVVLVTVATAVTTAAAVALTMMCLYSNDDQR